MMQSQLAAAGAIPRLLSINAGVVRSADGQEFEAELALAAASARSFHALVLPDGDQAIHTLAGDAMTVRFIKDQYECGNAVFALGASTKLAAQVGLRRHSTEEAANSRFFTSGYTVTRSDILRFVRAIGRQECAHH